MGCATQMSKANKLYEAGQYDDAATLYELILESDPSNVDAKIGLHKARGELWQKELVSVRMLRMAGDGAGALSRLESLLEKIQRWDMSKFSSGALASAEEEVRHARVVLEAQVRQKISEKKPVVADVTWRKFRNVRDAKFQGGFSGTISEEIRVAGISQCGAIKDWLGPSSFSFGSVASSLCARFGVMISLPALNAQLDYRFSKVTSTGELSTRGLDLNHDEAMRLLNTEVDSELSRAGLLAALSPHVFSLKVTGSAARDYEKSDIIKMHSYNVDIPYQAVEKYEEIEYVNVVENGITKSVQRKVPKVRTVTRMRKDPRTLSYAATDHREKFSTSLTIDAQNTASGYAFSNEQQNNFTSHTNDMPNVGLRPSPPKFIAATDWFKTRFAKAAAEFVKKIAVSLGNAQCQLAKGAGSSADVAEKYSRCAELNPQNDEAIAWFVGAFGYNRADLIKHLAQGN